MNTLDDYLEEDRPPQSALMISDAPEAELAARNWLTNEGWKVRQVKTSREAVSALSMETFSLIVADDSKTCSSLATIFHLDQSVAALATPVIPFLLQNRDTESAMIKNYGYPAKALKPTSREVFLTCLQKVDEIWSTSEYLKLKQLATLSRELTDLSIQKQAFEILVPMLKNPVMNSVVARILALIHWQSGKVKEAEKILLAAVRNQPKHPANLIALATFYVHFSQPALAVKLLRKGIVTHGTSCILKYPLAQALILLGQPKDAITILQMLLRDQFQVRDIELALAKLLLAEGQIAESERFLATIPEIHGIDLWHETKQHPVAG